MRKTIFTLAVASTLLLSTLPTNAQSQIFSHSTLQMPAISAPEGIQLYPHNLDFSGHEDAAGEIVQVASSKATAKSGSYSFKYKTNVRLDAGTSNRVLFVANKGTAASATHQKKIGSQVWYKVKVNGKSGWVLSTLLSPKAYTSKTAPSKAAAGSYKVKYNSNIRANAGTNHRILTLAKKGTSVKALASKKVGSSTWFKVSANGKTGWISGTLLSKTAASAKKPIAKPAAAASAISATGYYKVNYNSNVRRDAGTNHPVLTLAKKGATVKSSAYKKVGSTTWFKITANGKSGWISGALLTKTTAMAKPSAVSKASSVSIASNSAMPSSIISTALALKGTPYRFGGTTPAGFDCSGFIQYVFKQHGISTSRTTLTQFAETTTVSNPQPGDLVFFANTYRAGISHVGIYIGNNQFVHSGGSKAEVKSLNDVYWGPKFHSFKRF